MNFVPEAALVALREAIEAFLITGILLGFVVKLGRPDARRFVWMGLGAGIAASVAVGAVVHAFLRGAFESGGEQWYEMVADLVAVGVLTYMIIWMWKHTRTLFVVLREQVGAALEQNTLWVVAGLVFVSVLREGLEIVLFYGALAGQDTALDLALSAIVGTAAALAIVFAIFKGTSVFNIKKFFAVTGVFLIFIASGLLMHAAHEAEEIGIVGEGERVWDTSGFIPQDRVDGRILGALIGYRAAPTLLQVVLYFGYLLGVGVPYLMSMGAFRRRPTARAAPAPSPTQAPGAAPKVDSPKGEPNPKSTNKADSPKPSSPPTRPGTSES
ncbi:MAG TPA: FTR1 family protein [Candidatus Thermoplasmatota archaeon]|nr:FTR1 family protein [Candidatus Thermoplasmatota archaeon]